MIIAPSILSADLSCLKEDVAAVEDAGVEWLHLDVMDGNFVPNLTFGAKLIKDMRPHSKLFFDAHLMVNNPLDLLKDYIDAGVDQITVHIETLKNPVKELSKIKKTGIKVGLCLKPATSAEEVLPYLDLIDNILVMTVEPGFGGQSFMQSQLTKIKQLSEAIKLSKNNITLQVDGGINKNTISSCAKAGANVFVAGSAIFNGKQMQYAKNITELRELL